MQIGTTVCGFLAGVIFALVVLAIPPAVVEFRHDARMAMAEACHVLDTALAGCARIVADTPPPATHEQGQCES